MDYKATTAIYLDVRKARKDGSFPVKLRITHERKQKYYATGLAFSQDEFDRIFSARPRGEYKEHQMRLVAIEKKAKDIIEQLDHFSFEAFGRAFKGEKPAPSQKDVFAALEKYEMQLKQENRLRTAESYQYCRHSLQAYHKRKRLSYLSVNVAFLEGYEAWMLDQGKSPTTIGIYLRSLRTILNQAIRAGHMTQAQYPFGKGRYQIPASRNVKKALSLEDVKRIASYTPATESEHRYRDYWLFSYLCNGMNIKDMALLRYQNREGDKLSFIRAKTQRSTKQDQRTITVPLLAPSIRIIERWGNQPIHPQSFIFPILQEDQDETQRLASLRQETKQINKYMRRIGAALGIEKDITTYTARHTFSTVLKRSGAPIELISESLGHTNVSTTERYLDSFEDGIKRSFAEKLLGLEEDDKG